MIRSICIVSITLTFLPMSIAEGKTGTRQSQHWYYQAVASEDGGSAAFTTNTKSLYSYEASFGLGYYPDSGAVMFIFSADGFYETENVTLSWRVDNKARTKVGSTVVSGSAIAWLATSAAIDKMKRGTRLTVSIASGKAKATYSFSLLGFTDATVEIRKEAGFVLGASPNDSWQGDARLTGPESVDTEHLGDEAQLLTEYRFTLALHGADLLKQFPEGETCEEAMAVYLLSKDTDTISAYFYGFAVAYELLEAFGIDAEMATAVRKEQREFMAAKFQEFIEEMEFYEELTESPEVLKVAEAIRKDLVSMRVRLNLPKSESD